MDKPVKHIYERIAHSLRQQIEKGRFPSGKLPPERFLAEMYGVNRLTLRQAMKKLEKGRFIYRLGRKGTFVGRTPNKQGIPGRNVFAFVLAGEAHLDGHYAALLERLVTAMANVGQLMFIKITDAKRAPECLNAPGHALLDGIFVAGDISLPFLREARKLELPLVMLDEMRYTSPEADALDLVCVDSVQGGYRGAGFLLERGVQSIALLNGPPYQYYANFQQGYFNALTEFDVEPDPALICQCDHTCSAEGRIAEFLAWTNPEAVLVADRYLLDALQAVYRNAERYDIQTVAVTCQDEPYSLDAQFPLFHFLFSPEDIAGKAVRMMLERLDEPGRPSEKNTVLPQFHSADDAEDISGSNAIFL